jgi:hypothetical protein
MEAENIDPSRHIRDVARHAPPLSEQPDSAEDLSRYSYSVAQTVNAFFREGISVSERSIQRYCDSGKLKAVKINPDTREPTANGYYVYFIDPDSIPDRIAQLREKQDFAHPTVSSPIADMSRQDDAGSGVTRHAEPSQQSDTLENGKDSDELHSQINELKKEKKSLEIDKAARDQIVEFLQDDRKKVFEQLNESMGVVSEQGKQIGRLEERLQTRIEGPKWRGDNPGKQDSGGSVE